MKLLKMKSVLKLFIDLKFAMLLLTAIAFFSSLGSIIEQEESIDFYLENYQENHPIYGFIDANIILKTGLDHVYTTPWFFSLLIALAFSLTCCTITRQFPFFLNSKDYFFKKQKDSFSSLPFFVKIKNIFYLKEQMVLKMQEMHFYLYQKKGMIYGYKGLIGRISPILVHLSLLIILAGSSFGAFQNFKAQEILPKGEIFHVQNPIRIGGFTNLPNITIRVNDFWVEYEKNRIHQFYSNLSLLNAEGKEIKEQTISVNNPLRYQNIDFYQSDWNLLGLRIQEQKQEQGKEEEEEQGKEKIFELPMFSLQKSPKAWITWIDSKEILEEKLTFSEPFTLVFDQFQNVFFVYDAKGNFLFLKNIGNLLTPELKILEILPSTGLLIKYDPSIGIIYLGFGLLMITACLSYLPYTQVWVFNANYVFLGMNTNRGKISLEIDFENFIRKLEKKRS